MSPSRRSIHKTEQKHLANIGHERLDGQFLTQTIERIKKSLRVSKRKTKKPMIVAFVGLFGSGNSSVAKELKKYIGAYVLRNNEIRAKYLRPIQKEYHLYTEPILRALVQYILEKGGNVILDRDDVDGQTKEIIKPLLSPSLSKGRIRVGFPKPKIVHIRVTADRDVMMKRLIEANYDPKNNIIIDRVIALREMWRRTLLHYDWQKDPWPRFTLKKKLAVKPFATIDTTNEKTWKKQVEKIAKKLNTA